MVFSNLVATLNPRGLLLSFIVAFLLIHLPAPGEMVNLSPVSVPSILKDIKVFTGNPFHFEFILDRGGKLIKQG